MNLSVWKFRIFLFSRSFRTGRKRRWWAIPKWREFAFVLKDMKVKDPRLIFHFISSPATVFFYLLLFQRSMGKTRPMKSFFPAWLYDHVVTESWRLFIFISQIFSSITVYRKEVKETSDLKKKGRTLSSLQILNKNIYGSMKDFESEKNRKFINSHPWFTLPPSLSPRLIFSSLVISVMTFFFVLFFFFCWCAISVVEPLVYPLGACLRNNR